jgi:hypothetical protein
VANYSAARAVEVARLRLTQVLIRTLILDFGLHGHAVVARLRRDRPADYFRLVMIALHAAFEEAKSSDAAIDIYSSAELRSASTMAEAIAGLSSASGDHPRGIGDRLCALVRRVWLWWRRPFAKPETTVSQCDSTDNPGAEDGEA